MAHLLSNVTTARLLLKQMQKQLNKYPSGQTIKDYMVSDDLKYPGALTAYQQKCEVFAT